MKSKRLMGIIALAVCAVMLLCEVGQASTYIEGVTYYNPEDYQSSRYTQYKYNCKLFANVVVKDTTYSYGLPGWDNPDPNNHEMRYYPGWDDNLVAIYLNDQNGNRGPSASHLENVIFANAKQCDVVQMYWNSTEHTALISGFGRNNNGQAGVWFFEANVSGENGKEINNHFYTYERLASSYGNAGSKGGVSIYRFGEPIPKIDPPKITDAPNVALIAGRYTSYQCKADGSVSSWNINGDMPPGLAIDSDTGLISGTPISTSANRDSRTSRMYRFSIIAKNEAGEDQKSAHIQMWEPPLLKTESLNDGELRKNYNQTIRAEGTEYTMRWKIISGQLPPGLSFSGQRNTRTATISGTPIIPGTYRFTVQLFNFEGNPETTATKEYTIKITGIYPESNMWIEGNFKDGTVGEYYYSNAVSLYFRDLMYLSRWIRSGSNVSVVRGSLPPGLDLSWASSATWVDSKGTSAAIYLIGTPTTAGTYTFTIRAQNSYGGYTDSEQTVTISRPSRPFADSSMSIRYTFVKGKLGVSYNDYVAVWGGTSPYTVTKTLGIMPPGLSIHTNGRYTYLRGLPTRYGTYTFTLRATGAHNGYVDKEFTIDIANNSAYIKAGVGDEDEDNPTKPKLATKKIPDAAAYSEYNVTFEAGGTTPITWSYTGDLPEGFMFTDSGTLFGIPTEEGKYKFRVTAENSQGSVSKSFTLKVLPQKPVITNAALPDGTAGSPYSFTLESEGDSIKWTKSGKFPKCLKLDKNTGEIYGTPTKAGTYSFKVKAKNKAGKDTAEFTMTINENPEGLSADLTQSVNSAALPENNAASHETDSISITELYLLKDGQELDEGAEVPAGMPLTFRVGEVPDEDDSESKAGISGLKVFVNDEEIGGAEVGSDGTFTIQADTVNGTFSVYASGIADGEQFETTEIEIQAAGASEGSSTESSGGCSINLAGMIMLLMSGIVLMKK